MKVYYDLHIHSCLSPCADNDMTPNNIINMAKLLKLDAIAITDHNSCKNCRALVDAGKESGILVIPGMEICTAEEVHAICLFKNLINAESFGDFVYDNIPKIKNKPYIFGEQIIMDENDNEVAKEEIFLLNATKISINSLAKIVREYNGASFLSHVDRDSFSIFSSLGEIPSGLEFKSAEIYNKHNIEDIKKKHEKINNMNLLFNSDAHTLESINERENFMELNSINAKEIIKNIEYIRECPNEKQCDKIEKWKI